MKSLMFASSALAVLALAAEGFGAGSGAAVELQNYDPTAPNYVSPELFGILSPEQQARVVTVKPLTDAEISAGLAVADTAAPAGSVDIVGFVPNRSASLDERLSAIEDALSVLTTAPAPMYSAPVGGDGLSADDRNLLTWTERVLNKWHSSEKPDNTGAPISGH